ncbi:MAG: arylsulfatase, partial [Planctomycetes bacterium]|nr:arylsulfatase [Planctomycetota bacterium]
MNKTKHFKLAAIVLAVILSSQLWARTEKQPNVIVILTDDQGYGDMSCNGNPYIKTPEMDRLYKDGVRLTDFHVDPTCAPTRAALMTGRYSARAGVWLTYASRNHLRRDEVTMADVFKQNGYKTAIFGKWHLGENYPFRPMDRGFDESLIHGGGVVGEAPDYWDNNYYDDVYIRNGKPQQVQGYCTDVWFNETIRFIDQNKDRPFFIYLPTNAAHAPFHVPEKYARPYASQKGRAAFYGMIANIDENLGKLRDHLNKMSLERDTILVFFNDNGTGAGVELTKDESGNRNGWELNGYNAGMRGKKTSRYEGGHRAACFIHWPKGGLTGGRDIGGVTAHIDLLPTLIDLCGLRFKDKSRFDGIS